MFVTLTYDDSIQIDLFDAIFAVQNKTQNPNGCDIPGTFFVSTQYTDFWLAQRAYALNSEIAAHTINHPDLRNLTADQVAAEVQGSLKALTAFSGVPKSQLIGFRHPFLSFSATTFNAVKQAGFTYESSITLDPTTQGYWPHTLDYGMPYSPQPCEDCGSGANFKYPGLWEIPMYALLNTQGGVWASMDPIINPQLNDYDTALNNLKYTFQVHYDKRLPFGLYQHLAQYVAWNAQYPNDEKAKQKLLLDFITWTQTQFKDVWYVTNTQLLNWIKKPVPVDQMLNFLPCNPPPVDKSNVEICDGIDNDGDGIVDNGLMQSCQITDQANTNSCFGCPTLVPNVSNPVPPHGTGRTAVPDAGCPNLGVWDPVGAKCVTLVRPKAQVKTGNNTSVGGGNASSKSGAGAIGVEKMAVGALAAGLLAVMLRM
ncbi:hypothetical protein HDV00_000814 [Rhizophlyctis rosea]|nr:hypothetical protein HDV00_000814 [Rhizophlyctis rosea]